MEPDGDHKHTELVSPTPQRAYAFVSLLGDEDGIVRPQSTPWHGVGHLARPTSAPVSGTVDKSVRYAIERPTSPFSRVTNPMVRDSRFLRACGPEKPRAAPSRTSSSTGTRDA